MLWLALFIVGPAALTLDLGGRRVLTAASQLPLLHSFWLTMHASVAITVRGPVHHRLQRDNPVPAQSRM